MIYGIIGTTMQTIVNSTSYTPQANEIVMQGERPSADSIALADGTWQTISDIDRAKASKIEEFKQKRDTEEITNIEYNGNTFDYDEKARERLQVARQSLVDSGVESASIVWTTADNQRVELTVADFAVINSAVAYRSNALHVKYNELKEQINACETVEEVEAISWENDNGF